MPMVTPTVQPSATHAVQSTDNAPESAGSRPVRRPAAARSADAAAASAAAAPRPARRARPEVQRGQGQWALGHLEPLTPNEPVELDVEILPTSIVVPPGYQLALTILGRDYEVDGKDIALPNAPYPMKGVGPFLHIDKDDRAPATFDCRNTLHFAAGKQPYLLLPVIPES